MVSLISLLQGCDIYSHIMPWCALLAAVKNYNKSLEILLDFFFKTESKTKTWCSRPTPWCTVKPLIENKVTWLVLTNQSDQLSPADYTYPYYSSTNLNHTCCASSYSSPIRMLEYSFPRLFVPMMELSFSGPFVPWTIRSLELLFPGPFVPWTIRSRYRILRAKFIPLTTTVAIHCSLCT